MTKPKLITCETLKEFVDRASEDVAAADKLGEYLLAHYGADEPYEFESEQVEDVFHLMGFYYQWQDVSPDALRAVRLGNIRIILWRYGCSVEHVFLAIRYPEIKALQDKYDSGMIRRDVLVAQIAKLTSYEVDAKKVIELYEQEQVTQLLSDGSN